MYLSDYDYELPAELIAQEPLTDRSASRMLVVDRAAGTITDSSFDTLPGLLRPSDLLVLNNTRVFPARLIGRSETGARIELFLIKDLGKNVWSALARPARRLRPGKRVQFDDDLSAELLSKEADGGVIVQFQTEVDFNDALDKAGRTPLPPYIKRADGDRSDRERYQTVFAKNRGAIAAPTAGLHFTRAILDRIRATGTEVAEVTLHVGYGTFEPVRVDDLSQHRVSPEEFAISPETAGQLADANSDGRRIIAVGTTTTRALETVMTKFGRYRAGEYTADLTIKPGYEFKSIGGLLTNFHLPKSSLLVLVSTFGGRELIMKAYEHAVASRYRFYSYGDCMLII